MSHFCDTQLLVMGMVVTNTSHVISFVEDVCHACVTEVIEALYICYVTLPAISKATDCC